MRGEQIVDPIVTQEEEIQRLKVQNLRESLSSYETESNVAGISGIGDIWGSNTIFHYDQRQAMQ